MAELLTVFDLIDFTDTSTDFDYDDPPASPVRELATEIFRAFPRGWCSTFGAAANAFNLIVTRRRLVLPTMDGWRIAREVDDYRRLLREDGEVSVPWHRMRDKEGHCRTPRHAPGESAVVIDPNDQGNLRAIAEGMTLLPDYPTGRISPKHEFDICHAIRRGLVPGFEDVQDRRRS